MKLTFWLFGRPFTSAQLHQQRLPKIRALPVLSSDPLSSVAYATEEILRVLVLGGTLLLPFSMPISLLICLLIAILAISYWQTIHAYPFGGGAFTVAKENLSERVGLIAAAALLIDYVLTVAVSVSAGILALVSALPYLYQHTTLLCVSAIATITLVNLRGVRESAVIFSLPTYIFVVLILWMIGLAIYKMGTGAITAAPTPSIHPENALSGWIWVLLILRAFAAGCTAMTGIECIANSVPVFEKPETRNASTVLLILAGLLAVMFFGITYIVNYFSLRPVDTESLLSQLAHQMLGDGFLYYSMQAATVAILLLAANTAFTGFPRLASILAKESYLPRQLTNLGDRLSFSNGIVVLAILASALIIIFRGNTHHLIPLYAIGVFTAFSLSQLGMVAHWKKSKAHRAKIKLVINLSGFLATSAALLAIIESKFTEGAWLVVFCIPAFFWMFKKIKLHYQIVDRELTLSCEEIQHYLHQVSHIKPKVILPVSRVHIGTLAALNFARHVSPDVLAVTVNVDSEKTAQLQRHWRELEITIPLHILPSPYRSVIAPLKRFIAQEDKREPERGLCMLVMPEAIPSKWWHHLLHNQRNTLLKTSLWFNRQHKGGTRVFVEVPYQLKR